MLGECKKLKGEPFASPKRYSKSRQRVTVDDFDIDVIRCSVHDFYTRKEYPTLDKLLGAVKKEGTFSWWLYFSLEVVEIFWISL